MATDVTKIKFKLHMKDNFLACIAYQLNIEPKADVTDSACTDGFNIYYNPDFMDSLSLDEQVGVFAHECMHVALQHCLRLLDIEDVNRELWNIASDYVVNNYLSISNFKLPKGALECPTKYIKSYTEEIYKDLLNDESNKPVLSQSMDLMDPTFRQDSDESNGANNINSIKNQARKILGTAKSQASSKNVGGLCDEFSRAYDDLIKPKLPWERILRGYVNDTIKGDYSWRKPNKRFMDVAYLPSICDEEVFRNANVYIDTSGSVSEDMIGKFLSEVRKLHRDLSIKEMRINAFSIGITDTHTIGEKWTPPKAFGSRGGTEIGEVIEDINKHRAIVSIVITDGFFNDDPIQYAKYPIIWCIYDNNVGFKPSKGRVIEIPV